MQLAQSRHCEMELACWRLDRQKMEEILRVHRFLSGLDLVIHPLVAFFFLFFKILKKSSSFDYC